MTDDVNPQRKPNGIIGSDRGSDRPADHSVLQTKQAIR
jgi:hypothetical protein